MACPSHAGKERKGGEDSRAAEHVLHEEPQLQAHMDKSATPEYRVGSSPRATSGIVSREKKTKKGRESVSSLRMGWGRYSKGVRNLRSGSQFTLVQASFWSDPRR